MSYILDALRKAEKDRNLGRTPSLGDVTTPVARTAAPRASRREMALIGLVVGLLVLAVLLWPRAPKAPETTTVAVLPPTETATPVASTAIAIESPATEPTRPELDLSEGDAQAGQETPALDQDVAAESIDDLLDESGAPASMPAQESRVDEGIPFEAALDPASAAGNGAEAAEPTPAPAPTLEAAPEAPAEPAPGEIALLRDMPSDYRAAFPELRVDVHVYDDDPARRWALINGKKAVEGSTLAEGPKLESITADGIVFEFRGRTTMFPLRR